MMRPYTNQLPPEDQASLEKIMDDILDTDDIFHSAQISRSLIIEWELGLDYPVKNVGSFIAAVDAYIHQENSSILREDITGADVLLFSVKHVFPQLVRVEETYGVSRYI
jgi:hypothetical protein